MVAISTHNPIGVTFAAGVYASPVGETAHQLPLLRSIGMKAHCRSRFDLGTGRFPQI
jgi:hypothetical protein